MNDIFTRNLFDKAIKKSYFFDLFQKRFNVIIRVWKSFIDEFRAIRGFGYMCEHCDHNHCHEKPIFHEIMLHLPYAIFSVSFALVLLAVFSFVSLGQANSVVAHKGAKLLFHSFHFMHLVFAATGTVITYSRFSREVGKTILIGALVPAFFCMTSDVFLPYLGGRLCGIDMELHICFISELRNVLPFLAVGILNGLVMSRHHPSKQSFYSVFSHTVHILVSALAASFYLVSNGFDNWAPHIGFVFSFLIFAVVIPCSMSDLVVPMSFARMKSESTKH